MKEQLTYNLSYKSQELFMNIFLEEKAVDF